MSRYCRPGLLYLGACLRSPVPDVHTLCTTGAELCTWWAATDPAPWAVVSASTQASPCRGDTCLGTCSKMGRSLLHLCGRCLHTVHLPEPSYVRAAIFRVLWAALPVRMLAGVAHADRCRAGETQACADAAAELIQTLEATMEEQAAAAEAAAAEARDDLASLQERAAAGLQKAEADMAAAVEAAAADKEAAVGALQAQLQQLQVGTRLLHLPNWFPALWHRLWRQPCHGS